tara:strand:+ start:10266 stop:11621 length:1356 start_codon:yes stop_codon:yes gene_type:complete
VKPSVRVVGGGLAGCEAAYHLACSGYPVSLIEMRPIRTTEAHQTDHLGELVCTNSFKSVDSTNAHGQLKREMRLLGSLLLRCADATSVPAGSALAVDRNLFSKMMTQIVGNHPMIDLKREEIVDLPKNSAVIATGPLTSDQFSKNIRGSLGEEGLFFYDAIAPIVHKDSLDTGIIFEGGRYEESGDYLNCPMSESEYNRFIQSLLEADIHSGPDWDTVPYFEGCLPIEVMASRGTETLRFGPMKPIGLTDPRTGNRPYAVVQLRREDKAGQMWNLVGFQTRLRVKEQEKIFKMIPGLENCEFLRWGSIHRNTYLNFPATLTEYGSLKDRDNVIFAGQMTGVEGYTESAASGIMAAINLDRVLRSKTPVIPPGTTVLGGLYRYLNTSDSSRFQPMNSNWGLVDPLEVRIRNKKQKRELLAKRAIEDFISWMDSEEISLSDADCVSVKTTGVS